MTTNKLPAIKVASTNVMYMGNFIKIDIYYNIITYTSVFYGKLQILFLFYRFHRNNQLEIKHKHIVKTCPAIKVTTFIC